MDFELRLYHTLDGRIPYAEWLRGLDVAAAKRVTAYVDRMQTGNFGASKRIGRGVSELKIDYGPGYRIYYLRDGSSLIILLAGGDKGTQRHDIRRAVRFALDYWSTR